MPSIKQSKKRSRKVSRKKSAKTAAAGRIMGHQVNGIKITCKYKGRRAGVKGNRSQAGI